MKHNPFKSALALLVLGSAITLPAATNAAALHRSPTGITVDAVSAAPAGNAEAVAVGTSRIEVTQLLGPADTVLADGSWLYARYVAQSRDGKFLGAGTLVVRFAADRVAALTLANPAEVKALDAVSRARATNHLLAAGQAR